MITHLDITFESRTQTRPWGLFASRDVRRTVCLRGGISSVPNVYFRGDRVVLVVSYQPGCLFTFAVVCVGLYVPKNKIMNCDLGETVAGPYCNVRSLVCFVNRFTFARTLRTGQTGLLCNEGTRIAHVRNTFTHTHRTL